MFRYRSVIILSILVLAVFTVYSHTLNYVWHFDDSLNIVRNKAIHIEDFSFESVKQTFFAGGKRGDIYHPHIYRPVAMFSFAINHYFSRTDPFSYHVVNIVIHLMATIFLYLFIKKTLDLLDYNHAEFIAILATALWALNPVQISSVTYIVQRMNSMAAMFGIMGAYFYVRARIEKRVLFWTISALGMVLAIGSKENAIMLLFCLLLYDLFFIQGITKENVKRIGFISFCIVGIALIITLLLSGIETFMPETFEKGYARRDFTLMQRLMTEPRVILFYMLTAFLPLNHLLSISHHIPISYGFMDPPQTIVAILVIGILLSGACIMAKRWKLLSFVILFFFINHLIEGTIIPLELCFEHRNYLPSMLLFAPIAVLLVRTIILNRRVVKVVVTLGIVCLLVGYSTTTYQQNKLWETELIFWKDTVSKNPDPRAFFNYAGSLYRAGNYEEALKYWQVTYSFNKIFGTNYRMTPNIIPYGFCMYVAMHNANRLKYAIDKGWHKFKRAPSWTVSRLPRE